MSGKSSIEWTEHTWNPVVGCSIVSPGCTNCYAMKMAARIEAMGNQPRYAGTTRKVNGNAIWTGKLALAPQSTMLKPLRRKHPTTYFVNSMSDLFHEDAPDEWIDQVFAVMALCPQHTFQVLTKRADRMQRYLADEGLRNRLAWRTVADVADLWAPEWKTEETNGPHRSRAIAACTYWPLPNVWLGVSAERQKEADERIPLLLRTSAAVRFVSAEPLLGPIDLTAIEAPDKVEGERWTFDALQSGDYYTQWSETMLGEPRRSGGDGPYRDHAINWVIVGGESGPDARPFRLEWADDLIEQCRDADVACFVKQIGAAPLSDGYPYPTKSKKGGDPAEWPDRLRVRQMPQLMRKAEAA